MIRWTGGISLIIRCVKQLKPTFIGSPGTQRFEVSDSSAKAPPPSPTFTRFPRCQHLIRAKYETFLH